MYKTTEELLVILSNLLKVSENECVEFKRAKNNFDVDTLGKYFSALGNEANLKNKLYSWIIFGVDDKTHELTSTNYCIDNDFNKVKKQISDNTTDNISFIEIYTIVVNGKRVIMFQVPAASGTPINWKGFPYGRIGESLSPLSLNKIEQIKTTINYDWSRQVLEESTIDNLDKDAIKVAREQLKQARLARLSGDTTAYSTKINEENKLKAAETELQKQYDIYDNQSLTKDISDKNDFEMQKQLGITNAKTNAANTWGQSIGTMISGIGDSLLQHTVGNYDLLKSQNPAAVAQGMQNLYGHAFKIDENTGQYVLKDIYKNNPKYQQIAAVYNNYMKLQ